LFTIHFRQTSTEGGRDLSDCQRGFVLEEQAKDPSGSTVCVLLLGGERVGGRRDSDCEEITDEPTGCGICGKEGGGDCESEGHSYDRVVIELQMDVP